MRVLAQAGPLAEQIRAVAIDTLVSNILAIDAAGRPLTPLITYADTRNDADAIELRRTLDERAVHQRTGCLLRTSYWPARLAWFRRTQPDIWRATAALDHHRRIPGAAPVRALPRRLLGGLVERAARPAAD